MRVSVNPGFHVDTKLRKKPFFPGESFDLEDEKEAKRLIKAGVVTAIKAEGSGGGGSGGSLNVTQTVELVLAAKTIEELDKLAEGESRKGVTTAIEKRRAELSAPAE